MVSVVKDGRRNGRSEREREGEREGEKEGERDRESVRGLFDQILPHNIHPTYNFNNTWNTLYLNKYKYLNDLPLILCH